MAEQVSIVIPAFNAEKTIAQTIQACLNQDYAHVKEVIVIDDGSTDGTGERVRGAGVSCVRQNNAGPAQARNKGAALAAGDVICFTDADCVPHPNWVRSLMWHFSDPAVGAVMGSYGIANPQSWLARAVYQEIMFRHRRMPVYPKAFGSYNVAIRKTVFDNVGGFNGEYPYASGEDNDLSYRMLSCGYKIFFAKDALVDHHHPEMIKKYLREQYRHGFWRFKMYRAYPKMMRGDNYTFWKDSFEIFLSYCLLAALLPVSLPFFSVYILIFFVLTIFIIEISFSIKFNCENEYILKYSYVMLLRAVARAAGFTVGCLSTLLNRRRYPLISR